MFDRVSAKNSARELMRRYLGTAVGADMLVVLGSLIPFGEPAAELGLSGFYLDYADQKRAKASRVFRGFDNALKALGLALWRLLWMFLWVAVPAGILSLIGIVSVGMGIFRNPMYILGFGGVPVFAKIMLIVSFLWVFLVSIYKRIQYSFAFFVLSAHPECTVAECLRRSRDLTSDCFWELLVMRLSFIGWAILSAITGGLVGFFWAVPYFNFTYAVAYRQLDGTLSVGSVGGAAPVPSNPRLHGLNGVYAGMDFDFNPGEVLVLGRDETSCHIVFPESENKISRVHCRISYDADAGAYTVMDANSSNGTLLADGSRLKPNSPVVIQRGSVILLGDSRNSFRLE